MSPVEETKERILQAAAQVISDKGYAGATTREIAETADVNEVTLFRHFGNKKNILLAVIQRFSGVSGMENALTEELTGDYLQDLTLIGRGFLEMMNHNRKSILMTIAESQRLPEIREVIAGPPTDQRRMMGDYLRQQIDRGVVRPLPDPELAGQAFLGMFFEYSISQMLRPEDAPHPPPTEEIVSQLVDLFVQGTIAQEQ